jgi:hypothetical protein
MRALLLLTALLAAAPAAAGGPVDAAQRRCFCVKFSEPGQAVPYFLMKMDWQECKGRELSFLDGRTVYDLGLLACEDLLACLKTPPKEEKRREAAMKHVDDVTMELLACCRKGKENCDKACVTRLEPELNKAKAESSRLELKALRRQDACIAAKPPAAPPSAQKESAPGEEPPAKGANN